MKKLLLIALLALFPSLAQAQCTGIFLPNTLCGNNTATAQPPFQVSGSSAIIGPGTTTINDLALWGNTLGSSLVDQAPGALTKTDDTNVTLTLGGTPTKALVNAASLTLGWTGTLASTRLNANVVQAFTNDTNVTASITAQNATIGWTGTLAAARLNSNVVQSIVNDTNVTGVIAAQALTLGWTGQLALARGGCAGTDQSTCLANVMPTPTRTGDIAYWNGSIWTLLAGNNSGTQVLQENSSGLPSWVTVSGTGTVTSVDADAGLIASTTPTPITSTGTITLNGNYTGWALSNCTISATVAGGALTVALKDNAGNDPSATSPCYLNYRSNTAALGATTLVAQTSALSVSTPTSGATLGTSNNTAFRFWVLAYNNSGTNVLGIDNAHVSNGCLGLYEGNGLNSGVLNGSSTSAGIPYTAAGVSGKNFRIIGFIEYNSTGLVTAGTYASAPTIVQTFGPGIIKPCEVIQVVAPSFGTLTPTTFTTLTPTLVTATITPLSAANLIKYTVITTGGSANDGSGAVAQLYRSGNAIGPVSRAPSAFTAAADGSTISIVGYDYPNAATGTVYLLKAAAMSSTSQVPAVGTDSATEILEEIMD